MKLVKLILTVLVLAPFTACAAEPSSGTGAERTLAVNGTGAAAAVPDVAVVSLGVQTFAKTAAAAMAENNAQAQALIDALRAMGVGERDLQTQSINLYARNDQRRERNNDEPAQILLGYQANNVVVAKARDLERAGAVIDAAIKAGANRIDGIRFEISDSTGALALAREAAWANAEAKARQLAKLAGAELGEVLKVESYEHQQGPVRQYEVARFADSAPVQPGEQQLSVQVNVVWRLK